MKDVLEPPAATEWEELVRQQAFKFSRQRPPDDGDPEDDWYKAEIEVAAKILEEELQRLLAEAANQPSPVTDEWVIKETRNLLGRCIRAEAKDRPAICSTGVAEILNRLHNNQAKGQMV